MFCTNCGIKIEKDSSFCTECGMQIVDKIKITEHKKEHILKANKTDEKWWHRLLKVLYIVAYLPLLLLIPMVWSENEPYCSSYSSYCDESYSDAFWYSTITLVIYILILRLIKIAVKYIIIGEKPNFREEFKKLF